MCITDILIALKHKLCCVSWCCLPTPLGKETCVFPSTYLAYSANNAILIWLIAKMALHSMKVRGRLTFHALCIACYDLWDTAKNKTWPKKEGGSQCHGYHWKWIMTRNTNKSLKNASCPIILQKIINCKLRRSKIKSG